MNSVKKLNDLAAHASDESFSEKEENLTSLITTDQESPTSPLTVQEQSKPTLSKTASTPNATALTAVVKQPVRVAKSPAESPSLPINTISTTASPTPTGPLSAPLVSMTSFGGHTSVKVMSELVKTVLAHLYCPNLVYQARAIETFYHPTQITFSDPFLTVNGAEALRELFSFYFSWFVASSEVEIHHITVATELLHMASPEATPTQSYFTRSGQLIVADYTLRVLDYTHLGSFLKFFGLLPPLILFAYAPRKETSAHVDNIKSEGLRILSKFHWIDEPSSAQVGRLCIISQEDIYSVGSIVNYFLQLPLAVLSRLLYFAFAFVAIVLRWVPETAKDKLGQALKKARWGSRGESAAHDSSIPHALHFQTSSTEKLFKEPLGWLLTSGLQTVTNAIQQGPRFLSSHFHDQHNLHARIRNRKVPLK